MTTKLIIALFLMFFSLLTLANNQSLEIDIAKLKMLQFTKKPLESTLEYNARKQRVHDEYLNRTYRLVVGVYNPKNKTDGGLVSYDTDTETLTVSMPELQHELVWLMDGGEKKLKWINYSFLDVNLGDIKKRTYVGQNGFGRKVKVLEIIFNSNGVAILSTGKRNETYGEAQSFTTTVSRSKARDILENGKLVLTFRNELQFYDTDNIDDEGASSLLIIKKTEHEPTITRPIHSVSTKYMLPVRLIHLSLHDGKGAVILQAQGSQIETSPYDEE